MAADELTGGIPESLAPLFEPLEINGLEIPNRVMTSAMTLQYSEENLMSDRHRAFYRERAEGGVGLLFSEQMTASPLDPSAWSTDLRAYDERQVERFAALAKVLEPYPTRFFAQLFAPGAEGSTGADLGEWPPVRAPSTVGVPGADRPLPFTVGEIQQLIQDFARSAQIVKDGGLDGLEVHGAHGWLVGQFLSPFNNRREDEYGGSLENRCRFPIEIGRAIRDRVGPDFPFGLTLSYDELIGESGITEEETLAQIEVFLATGIFDFFDISLATPYAVHHQIPPMSVPEGVPLSFAARAKALVGDKARIFIAGRIVKPQMAADAIRNGDTDMVAMSRAHLADPMLTRKARLGRIEEATRCVGANVCVGRAILGQPVACVLTPATGREVDGWKHGDFGQSDPAERKRVIVAGAGPAGLRAGAIAAARGHDVRIVERSDRAGGHLSAFSELPSRDPWGWAVEDMITAAERAGASIELGKAVDAGLVADSGADLLLVATGATWDDSGFSVLQPERPGIAVSGGGRVMALDKAMRLERDDPGTLGEHVLIADQTGTYLPLGFAELLAICGTRVTVASANGEVGADTVNQLEQAHVLPRLRALDVELISSHYIDSVTGTDVTLANVWAGRGLDLKGVSTVVLALERIATDALAREVAELGTTTVRTIGDARVPRATAFVIQEAERFGRSL